MSESFGSDFERLTGNAPFPWQCDLFERFVNDLFPQHCDIPTGLGKTSVIPIWLLALAERLRRGTATGFPRRLVYVVNRRTVVDQATQDARQLRDALARANLREIAEPLRSAAARPSESPLAISTLRGEFADNGEWSTDPARPAVIVGTVDMIGSRLLFSGYGRGFKTRPLHAGFLAQDALLVHDEAHLEPAFQQLLSSIEVEQERSNEFRRLRVLALTATSRADDGHACGITGADLKNAEVAKRVKAKKGIAFHEVSDEKKLPDDVLRLALQHKDGGQAILIYLRSVEHVEDVARRLERLSLKVQPLTGTLRGLERDALAKEDPVFARFKPGSERTGGTVYLVCTSAGEVGVNISADHLVCDLTPFDSMAQRFGRVNRFGDGDARIDIVHVSARPGSGEAAETGSQAALDLAREHALALLHRLPERRDHLRDASPAALRALLADVSLADREAAFTPPPVILPVTDILLDAWALTSVRDRLPGRPPVAAWLHGVADWEPPETHVAWRQEVELIRGKALEEQSPEDLLEDYPLKPHEQLRGRTRRVFEQLSKLAEGSPDRAVWLVSSEGGVKPMTLAQLTRTDRYKNPVESLADCTVILPPRAGGLDRGLLNGDAPFTDTERYDVADEWHDQENAQRRCRRWDDEEPPPGMRLVRTIDIPPESEHEAEGAEGESERRLWCWYVQPQSGDDDGSKAADREIDLDSHLASADQLAQQLAARLGLSELEASAVRLAGRCHDRGKNRLIWQRSIRNSRYPERTLAKSRGKMLPRELNGYRHEFGSLLDVSTDAEVERLTPEARDLVLHLIAAHHGRARPHFAEGEVFDDSHGEQAAAEIAREVPRRFARLQRRYGRWGLAYIESLVRAADAMASRSEAVK
jgi:CRISPR-associated endonuclease/helicase Cas3